MAKFETAVFPELSQPSYRPETKPLPEEAHFGNVLSKATEIAKPIMASVAEENRQNILTEQVRQPLAKVQELAERETDANKVRKEIIDQYFTGEDTQTQFLKRDLEQLNRAVNAGRLKRSDVELLAMNLVKKAQNQYGYLAEDFVKEAKSVMGYDVIGSAMKSRMASLDEKIGAPLGSDEKAGKTPEEQELSQLHSIWKSLAIDPTTSEHIALNPAPPTTIKGYKDSIAEMSRMRQAKVAAAQTKEDLSQNLGDLTTADVYKLGESTNSVISASLGPVQRAISQFFTKTDLNSAREWQEQAKPVFQQMIANGRSFVESQYASMPPSAEVQRVKEGTLKFFSDFEENVINNPDLTAAKRNTDLANLVSSKLKIDLMDAYPFVFRVKEVLGSEALANLPWDWVGNGKEFALKMNEELLRAAQGDPSKIHALQLDKLAGVWTGVNNVNNMDKKDRAALFGKNIGFTQAQLNANTPVANIGAPQLEGWAKSTSMALQTVLLDNPDDVTRTLDIINHPKFLPMVQRLDPIQREILADSALKVATQAINSDVAGGGILKNMMDVTNRSSGPWSVTWDRNTGKFLLDGGDLTTQRLPGYGQQGSGASAADYQAYSDMQKLVPKMNKYLEFATSLKQYDKDLSQLPDNLVKEILIETGGLTTLTGRDNVKIIGDSQIAKQVNKNLPKNESDKAKVERAKKTAIQEITSMAQTLGRNYADYARQTEKRNLESAGLPDFTQPLPSNNEIDTTGK